MRIHEKVSRLYKLLDASNKLGLAIAPGPHDEVPELRLAVLRWFNRHLKAGEKETENPITIASTKFFTPEQLRVFSTLPTDAINTNIADTFVPSAKQKNRTPAELTELLRAKVFAGWPTDDLPLDPRQMLSVERDGLRLTAWEFTSQHDVSLRLYLVEDATRKDANAVQLHVLDENSGPMWLHDLRAGFGISLADEPSDTSRIANIVSPLVSLKAKLKSSNASLAWFAPRGIGLSAFTGDDKALTKIRRRFMLLGQTLDGMRVWDIRRAVQTIHFVREADAANVELHARDKMAVNSLYAALFEPGVKRLVVGGLPASHSEGPDYLGILRVTDMPEVLGILGTKVQVQ
ncbi:MAG TPA: hypothetical protein VFZ59_01650 [Verrucomicrobiae bacterium]|nr:hypothetical protein [Verrucomicrobiae bacterium]